MPAGRPKANCQLDTCREVGLTCFDCVQSTAQQLAQISAGLPRPKVRQFFNALYPQPQCLRMVDVFVQIVVEKQGVAAKPPHRETELAEPAHIRAAVA
jgi:hypothetical protein